MLVSSVCIGLEIALFLLELSLLASQGCLVLEVMC